MDEYEYNLRVNGKVFYHTWSTEDEMIDLWSVDTLEEVKDKLPTGWTLIKRIKPGKIEDA